MRKVRRNDLAVVRLGDREVKGTVEEVREEAAGHERVVVSELGGDETVDTSADRVEVVR